MMDDAKLQVYYMRNLPKEVRGRFLSDMGFVVGDRPHTNYESVKKWIIPVNCVKIKQKGVI